MSRGFVKENDQEEIPMVTPRADLPANVVNYVTPNGLEALLTERAAMLHQLENITAINENERRIAINFLHAKLDLLNDRIASAKVVDLSKQPKDEIRFGATVTVAINDQNQPQHYQIVGVDEANIKQLKISFISPIAQLLLHKKVGDEAVLKLASRSRVFTVQSIAYS